MRYFDPDTTECPPFPCGTTEFDLRAAWWLAEFSRLAYEPKQRVALELENAGFHKVTFFDSGGTQAYLAHYRGDRQFAVLAFRGTESDFTDLLTDVSFFPRKTSDQNFRAHGGFLAALRDVWDTSASSITTANLSIEVQWEEQTAISEALDELKHGNPHGDDVFLCFTGHSLGGALATLAANRFPPDVLYTFGSPRVAGRRLARRLNKSNKLAAYRVVNSTDIIARVPLHGRFAHVGRLVYLKKNGGVSHCESPLDRLGELFLDSFLLLVGLPIILLVKLICVTLLGTLFTMIVPPALLRLNSPSGGRNAFLAWWQDTLKPWLLFMFTNHRVAGYSRKLAKQIPAPSSEVCAPHFQMTHAKSAAKNGERPV